MTRYGTSHFVSKDKAVRYYYNQAYGEDLGEVAHVVNLKLELGEIHIGPPILKPNERLVVIDDGARYAIETD